MNHFSDKQALEHVVEKKVSSIFTKAEQHGIEIAGYQAALYDAAKDTAVYGMILSTIHSVLTSIEVKFLFMVVGLAGWVIWKISRSALIGWSRLEKLHRLIEQEKYEIEHHQEQERAEIEALYQAKGFRGKLLQEVIDVLMADPDRLLKVMLEEELGLQLQAYEHPLKQALGAACGAVTTAILLIFSYFFLNYYAIYIVGACVIGAITAWEASKTKDSILPSLVWSLALTTLAVGSAYYIMQILLQVLV